MGSHFILRILKTSSKKAAIEPVTIEKSPDVQAKTQSAFSSFRDMSRQLNHNLISRGHECAHNFKHVMDVTC